MQESHELDRDECLRLLRSDSVGRVALSAPDGPHIIPMNYAVVDDLVVFRTTPYSIVGTYGPNTGLAFEVDRFDREYWTGWSVVVRGRGTVVADPAEIERIDSVWKPRPWAAGRRNLYFALPWTEINGRRLGPDLVIARREASRQ